MPACIKAPLRAPALCVRGAVFPAPAACDARCQNLPAPFFQGASKPGTAQPLQNSGAAGRPAHAGGRGPHPGKNTPLRGRRLYLPHNSPSEGLSALTLRCRQFVPPCAGSEGFLQAASTGGLPPVGILCPCITGRQHKKAQAHFAPALYHSAFLPPLSAPGLFHQPAELSEASSARGHSSQRRFYSNSTVAGGLPVQSYKTRFTCGTSFTMRLAAFCQHIPRQGAASPS